MLLPDGSLKRQLLTEIAECVQEDLRDLQIAWGVAKADPKPRRAHAPAAQWTRRFPTRPSVDANARNIARLLLSHSIWWEDLTHEDHEVLCGLEGECAALFRWIDSQVHDHGPQPLAALQAGLEGQPFQALAAELIALETMQPLGRVVDDAEPRPMDLRLATIALRIDVIDLQLKELQSLPATDSSRPERQASLIREQFELKKQLNLLKTQEKRIM
jgi:DNA primase